MSDGTEWIKEFLEMADEKLDEINEPEANSSMAAVREIINVDDDDDCIVLDGDPEKVPTTSVNGSPTGSDDLVVVGEKGQIACRDYPHPRHICANFPYSSTPHERYCVQCHCYVCDSPAPCLMWGTGLSTTDHCHATDKSHMWKTLREKLKSGIKSTAPLSSSASTSRGSLGGGVGNSNSQQRSMIQVPQQTIMRMCPMPNYNLQNQNQFSRPNNVPVRSTTSNYLTMLSSANNGRSEESGSISWTNKYQSHSIPRQLLGVQNHAIQKAQGQGTRSLETQFHNPNMMSNSLGPQFCNRGTLPINNRNHVNPRWQHDRFRAATEFPNGRNCLGQLDVLTSKANTNLRYGSNYSNSTMPYQAQSAYSSIQGNDALSSYMAGLNRNQHLNDRQIGNQNENAHHGNIIWSQATPEYARNSGYMASLNRNQHQVGSYMASLNRNQHQVGNQNENIIQRGVTLEYGRNSGFYFQPLDSSVGVNSDQNILHHPQSFGSIMPLNAMESSSQSTAESSNFSLDELRKWLLDEPN